MTKVVLADQDRIDAYKEAARELFRSVLDVDYEGCVVTDESRLSDFSSCGLPDGLGDAAKGQLYAAWDDVSPTILLVELVEKIEQQRERRLH